MASFASPRATSLARSPLLFLCRGSTFLRSTACTTSRLPPRAAMCSAFSPLCVRPLGLAPAATSARAVSRCAFWHAKCNGVIPSIASAPTFAPEATRNFTASVWSQWGGLRVLGELGRARGRGGQGGIGKRRSGRRATTKRSEGEKKRAHESGHAPVPPTRPYAEPSACACPCRPRHPRRRPSHRAPRGRRRARRRAGPRTPARRPPSRTRLCGGSFRRRRRESATKLERKNESPSRKCEPLEFQRRLLLPGCSPRGPALFRFTRSC